MLRAHGHNKGAAAASPSKRKRGVPGSSNSGHGKKKLLTIPPDVGGEFSGVNEVFHGVSLRVIVEIKNFCGRLDFHKTLPMSKAEAAIVHDLARLYESEGNYPEKDLNIDKVGRCIQKEVRNGKELLLRFVREHPLKHARAQWKNLGKKEFKALKDEIADLAPHFCRKLKDECEARKITPADNSCRRRHQGFQRKDLVEIPPSLQENDLQEDDPMQGLRKENQHLKDKVASFEKGKEKDAATIASLQEELQTARSQLRLPSPTLSLDYWC